jgi:hypothetical protein
LFSADNYQQIRDLLEEMQARKEVEVWKRLR